VLINTEQISSKQGYKQTKEFSFAEFVCYVLFLQNFLPPPPNSELTVIIAQKEILFKEGDLTELPCIKDISVSVSINFN
jgi:hypothetical protein